MRLSTFVLVSSVCGIPALVACTTEAYPNPPATRDGTEEKAEDREANLPSPSNPPSKGSSGDDASKGDDGSKGADPEPAAATSGVDPDKTIGELTANEKKSLCDWQAALHGGYGKKTTCDGNTSVSAPKSQAECVQDLNLPTCQATVAQAEACIEVDAKDPCALAILTAPECEPLVACMQ